MSEQKIVCRSDIIVGCMSIARITQAVLARFDIQQRSFALHAARCGLKSERPASSAVGTGVRKSPPCLNTLPAPLLQRDSNAITDTTITAMMVSNIASRPLWRRRLTFFLGRFPRGLAVWAVINQSILRRAWRMPRHRQERCGGFQVLCRKNRKGCQAISTAGHNVGFCVWRP